MSTGDYAKSIASFAERSRSVNVRNLSTGDTIVVRQLNSARISFGRVFAPYAVCGTGYPRMAPSTHLWRRVRASIAGPWTLADRPAR